MLEKYLSRTVETAEGCLVWQGRFNTDGYPRAGNKNTSNLKVHREVFFLTNGFYPDVVRHTCDNITCINPEHLIAGDNIDNINDRHERGRTFNQVFQLEVEYVKLSRENGLTFKEIAE